MTSVAIHPAFAVTAVEPLGLQARLPGALASRAIRPPFVSLPNPTTATPARSVTDSTALLRHLRLDRRIPVNQIKSTQFGLRRGASGLEELRQSFLAQGGRFHDPVDLEYFPEDGRIAMRNGHHRLAVWQKEGITDLDNSDGHQDFNIKISSYVEYAKVNFVIGSDGKLDPFSSWLTPFDPRTHVRHPDFRAFKMFIKLLADNGVPFAEIDRFIHEHGELYLVPVPPEGVRLKARTAPVSATRDFADYLRRMVSSMGPKIAQLIPLVPADGVIFDIGSGSGDQSYAYSQQFPQAFVVGVDVAPQSIEHARAHFNAANLVFLLGNAINGFAPKNSGNTVIDSSIVHELFSFTEYSRDNIRAYFKQVADVLLPGGNYGSRDFSSPFWPGKVRIKLPTTPEAMDVPYGKYSRAELFEIYARDLKTADYPNGVSFAEIPSEDAQWREFELDGLAAANFILRMEYRRNWEPELKEQYLYWNLDERIAALEQVGFRVDYAAEVYNEWIYQNWWKNRLVVTDTEDNHIDLPPTNMIVFAVKPGPNDPVSLDIVKTEHLAGSVGFPIHSYREKTTGTVWDTVHVEGETQQFVPYEQDANGDVYVYVVRRAEKPALRHYANVEEIFHVRYGGYASEGLSVVTSGKNDGEVTAAFSNSWGNGDSGAIPELQANGAFFPTPGLSDERVTTHFVPLDTSRVNGVDFGKFQRVELKQLVAGANVGSVPDGRLEVAAYALARRSGTKLLPWFNGPLPIVEQNAFNLTTAPHYPVPSGTNSFVPSETHASFGETLSLKVQRVEFNGKNSEFTREYLAPAKHSLDTFSVIPYVKSGGKILVGLETCQLPTFQVRGLESQISVTPAWRIPRGIKSREAVTRWLKDRMIGDFDLHTLNVTSLGEGYFPSAETTPEKVTPFAVEVDATRLPRDLTFVPLEELLAEIEKIPDLHTRVAIYRLAHSMGLL